MHHPLADLDDRPCCIRKVDELGRADKASPWMLPAEQSFEGTHLGSAKV